MPDKENIKMKILVADDEKVMCELICDILQNQGYETVVAHDGKEAFSLFMQEQIDLIVLDVMMPKYDGWTVLEKIREFSDVPIIILTALESERNELRGLTTGADDYITKPFSYEVFVARVNVLLKKQLKKNNSIMDFGDLTINQLNCKISVQGKEIQLTNLEYKLLLYLVENENIVKSREQIFQSVWGSDNNYTSRTIDTHIKVLRAKLGVCSGYIQTVRGRGYCFSRGE